MIIELQTEPRLCQCCESSDLDFMWSNTNIIARKNNAWQFTVNVSICRNCGFCFSSPAPNNKQLMQYYEDGNVGFKEISLPYLIEERLRILEKYKDTKGIFVEIGGDGPGEFHQKCKKYFKKIFSVEVTQDLKDKSIDLKSLKESVSVIVHYDVLEHVLNIKDFLSSCHSSLKPNGVMICEVPNLKLYPENLLLLEPEHINHFTISSLNLIAKKIGFTLIEFDEKASRPYGFVAVFRKVKAAVELGEKYINEYSDAKNWILGGLKQIKKNELQLISLRQKIVELTKNNSLIIIWGVTDLLRSLLKNFKINDNVIIVDSDPRRKNDLLVYGLNVMQPKDCIDKLLIANLLIICAPRYKDDILAWVKTHTKRLFCAESLDVIGVNSSGKTLR